MTQMHFTEWVNKLWYIYTMEFYSTAKKNKTLTYATTWANHKALW